MKGNILMITFAVFTVSVIITINLFLQENYQAEMAEQFNKQQLLLATTISDNIQSHFSHIEEMAAALSRLLSKKVLRDPSIKEFVDDSFQEIIGEGENINLRIFDDRMVPVVNDRSFSETSDDRFLIEESMHTKKLKPLYLDRSLSENAIKLAMPILDDGKWRGVLMLDISLDYINEKFIIPIKSGSKGYAWMMDSNGTLLYHPMQPDMIGKNLYNTDPSCFNCHKSFEVEKWIIRSGGVGAKSYISPLGEDKLIAFSSVNVIDTRWIVCVSIPYSEITASIRKSMKLHSILVITIFIAAIAGAFTTVIINRRRIKAEEKAKHEDDLQKYASELEHMVEERTEELSTEKEKLNTIVNTVAGGLMLVDNYGRIQWTNRTVTEMAGRDIVGLNYDEISSEGHHNDALISDRSSTSTLMNLFGKVGRYFQVIASPLKSGNDIIGHIWFIQDITEMKRVEEQMVHSEKLASLGRLTAGIAHEIGNPLTSVSSFLQILREMETDEFKVDSLETIMFHMNRIAEIVRQLSGFSKLPPSEYKQVSINDLIESSIGLLQYDKRAKAITTVKNLDPSLPPTITDGNQLSQVFVNLILNAADAMHDGGTLTISTHMLNKIIAIDFEDTGHGIPQENLSSIFDPFFTTKDKGTGLGLSVSYGIIKRLGGDITVISEPGKGTKFTVTLPVMEKTNE